MNITLIICICALIPSFILLIKIQLCKPEKIMSIKESIDLTGLPIITLTSNGKKLNFILDSGSNESHISSTANKKLKLNKKSTSKQVYGIGGNAITASCVEIKFEYNNKSYSSDFLISESLDESFKAIKESEGVNLHGIIGTDFMRKYSYILDFNKLAVYAPKKTKRFNIPKNLFRLYGIFNRRNK